MITAGSLHDNNMSVGPYPLLLVTPAYWRGSGRIKYLGCVKQISQSFLGRICLCLLYTSNLTVVGLLWRAGQGIGTEPVMPGDILAIIQYVMQIMMSVTMLSMIFVMYPRRCV